MITLKSLLVPNALVNLEPETVHYFCSVLECVIVYFNEKSQTFSKSDLKVPIFQKDKHDKTPVCYCFGWTGQRLLEEMKETGRTTAVQNITMHIKAKRCGCEVNNPQGSCCLGNVTRYIQEMEQ